MQHNTSLLFGEEVWWEQLIKTILVDILGQGYFSFTDNAEKLCKGIVKRRA